MPAPGLDLLHRPDLPALIARWQQFVVATDLPAHYERLRCLADDTACHRWLLDLRRRGDLTDSDVNTWFSEVFAPSLRGRYPAPARLAFLISPLCADEVTASLSPHNTDCAVATFTDEAAAYYWLGL